MKVQQAVVDLSVDSQWEGPAILLGFSLVAHFSAFIGRATLCSPWTGLKSNDVQLNKGGKAWCILILCRKGIVCRMLLIASSPSWLVFLKIPTNGISIIMLSNVLIQVTYRAVVPEA